MKCCTDIFSGKGPPSYSVSGNVCHYIGNIAADSLEKARNLQVYFYDPDQQLDIRKNGVHKGIKGKKKNLGSAEIRKIQKVLEILTRNLNQINPYIQLYTANKDKLLADSVDYKIVYHEDEKPKTAHARTYNKPSN